MRGERVARIGLLALFFAVRLPATANSPVPSRPPACWEKTEKVCQALRIPDPARRTSEARAALVEMLKSDDAGVASAIGAMVERLRNRVDLRPYADLFMASCERSKARCFWSRPDEDWALVWAGSRSERLDVFERAIRSGSARLAQDTIVQRKWAVRWAAEQGLEELRPLADEYLATLTEARIKKLELTNVSAMFELCAGAGGYFDAARLAARRSAALPDQEFETRMTEEEGFRGAVLAIGRRICETDPLMDDVAPECSLVAAVADRHRKVPAGPPVFDDSCWGGKAADWRATLWCSTRQGSYRQAKTVAFGALPEASALRKGDYRRPGLDPCSLPELGSRDGWTQGRFGSRVKLSEVNGEGRPSEVDMAAGIVHRRSGERVRLKIDVTERQGGVPASPIVVHLALEGPKAGSLSRISSDTPCRQLTLLWSDPAGSGQRWEVEREFDVVLGPDAGLAALIPDEDPTKPLEPWWHRSGTLKVSIGRTRDDGETIEVEGDQQIALRAEGASLPAINPILAVVEKLRQEGKTSAFLDDELEERTFVVNDLTQAFFVFYDSEEKKDSVEVSVSSKQEGGDKADEVKVSALRIPNTHIFVGALTLAPEGHSDLKRDK